MSKMDKLTDSQIKDINTRFDLLVSNLQSLRQDDDIDKLKQVFGLLTENLACEKDLLGDLCIDSTMDIAEIAVKEIGLGVKSVISIFLNRIYRIKKITYNREIYGESIDIIAQGLIKVSELGEETLSSQAENYRMLLLNLAKDVRVILIKIAEQLHIMRKMKLLPKEQQIKISYEASYLYAPLAHRLGLYLIKSEITKVHIASCLGVANETIIRLMSEMKSEELISYDGKKIIINDLMQLKKISST